jgi:hypothetical protein
MTSIVSDSEIDQELHPLLQLFETSKMLRSVYLKDSSLDLTYQWLQRPLQSIQTPKIQAESKSRLWLVSLHPNHNI